MKNIGLEEITRRVSSEIAAGLFRNGAGDQAKHLVLTSESGRNLGGWCENAVAFRIFEALMKRRDLRDLARNRGKET